MSETPEPPVAKYRYTLTLTGNSHDEIEHELLVMTRGGYLLDSDHYERDAFSVVGGRKTSVLVCTNPDQTPEAYDAALSEWWEARKAARLASPAADDAGRQ
jgi:hypothetical protein